MSFMHSTNLSLQTKQYPEKPPQILLLFCLSTERTRNLSSHVPRSQSGGPKILLAGKLREISEIERKKRKCFWYPFSSSRSMRPCLVSLSTYASPSNCVPLVVKIKGRSEKWMRRNRSNSLPNARYRSPSHILPSCLTSRCTLTRLFHPHP